MSKQVEHSPLPWRFIDAEITDSGHYEEAAIFSFADPDNPKIVCTLATRNESEANGNFIVEAVNSHSRLTQQVETLKAAVIAANRILASDYLLWSEAGGPNECAHGFAAGVPCPSCDRETIRAALASCAPEKP